MRMARGKPEFRGFINPVPSLPEAAQREFLAKYGPMETYVIGKDGDHEDFIRQMRPPRVCVVSHVGLLAIQKGKKDDRVDSMAGTKAAIHHKGCSILEASTGRSSLTKWPAMRSEGAKMCGRIAQGAKSALNSRKGAIGYGFTNHALRLMARIMESPRYQNDDMRIAALKEHGIEPVPKRTWLKTKLPLLLRDRGLEK
jgi:hypothetical protein